MGVRHGRGICVVAVDIVVFWVASIAGGLAQVKPALPSRLGEVKERFLDSQGNPLVNTTLLLFAGGALDQNYRVVKELVAGKRYDTILALKEPAPLRIKTDNAGAFVYIQVPPGRYTIGLSSKNTPGSSELEVLKTKTGPILFDLKAGEKLSLGTISRSEK